MEDTSVFQGKEVQAVLMTVDRNNGKLVLSVKEVLKEKEHEAHSRRVAALPIGTVVEGTVETIQPYGAFVSIGNGLSGLLHISQISNKRLKSPHEVLKLGQTITVKLLDVKDGKISLSMRAADEGDEVEDSLEEASPESFSSEEIPAPTLGDLLSKLNLNL